MTSRGSTRLRTLRIGKIWGCRTHNLDGYRGMVELMHEVYSVGVHYEREGNDRRLHCFHLPGQLSWSFLKRVDAQRKGNGQRQNYGTLGVRDSIWHTTIEGNFVNVSLSLGIRRSLTLAIPYSSILIIIFRLFHRCSPQSRASEIHEIVRSETRFWIGCCISMVSSFSCFVILLQHVSFLQDCGISVKQLASIQSTVGVVKIFRTLATLRSLCIITTLLSGLSSAALPTDMHAHRPAACGWRVQLRPDMLF